MTPDGGTTAEALRPGSAAYEAARRPRIARFAELRPAVIVRCASPRDVSEAIALARREGAPIAVRSGGHCFAGRSSTTGLLIDVSPMRSVAVADGTVTIGAGARLGDVYDALAAHGVTLAAGCGPTVGIAGLTLGGGLGILGRAHGLTCDQLLAARVVLADGRVVDCDADRDADLFWALRGAGNGTLGVVCELTFRTVAAPPTTSFVLTWPPDRAAALLEAWQAWAPDGPDELAASLLATSHPPQVKALGAFAGSEPEARRHLAELAERAGAEPATADVRHGPLREAKRHLSSLGEGDDDGHPYSKSEFFARSLPSDAVAALLAHFAEGQWPRELDFSPWAGAYNRVPADATAFVHRGARFLLKQAVVLAPDAPEDDRDVARRWLGRSWELVHPYGTGGVYPNFPDPDLPDAQRAYHGANLERVLEVRARYDREGLFG